MARSKIEIIIDMLQTVKENSSCKKTTIVRIANLDWNMANKYLKSLIEDGFINKIQKEKSKGGRHYQLSEKGENLLKVLKRVKGMVSIFG